MAETSDIKVAITGPLDDLLLEHADEIAKLKEMVADILPEEWDEIWLLRYLLSNGLTAEGAVESVRFSIDYREKNAEALKSVAAGNPIPNEDTWKKFQVAGPHKTDKDGAPAFIVRIGLSNPSALMDVASHESVVEYFMLSKEREFRECDRLTREKRKLVKCTGIQDMAGMSLKMDRRFFKALGESSKLSEKVYPQLLGDSVPINTPSFMKIIMKLFSPFMSKRMLEKMKICPVPNTLTGDITKCPFIMSKFNIEDIPTFLGGTCTCGGKGCINGVPNSQTVPISAISEDGEISLNVASRSSQAVEVGVLKGSTVDYSFSVAKNDIKISAHLVTEAGEELPLLDMRKAKASEGKLEGSWEMPAEGIVKFVFDNTASYMTSKNVKYSLNLRA